MGRSKWGAETYDRVLRKFGFDATVYFSAILDIRREDKKGKFVEDDLERTWDCFYLFAHYRDAAIIPAIGDMAVVRSFL